MTTEKLLKELLGKLEGLERQFGTSSPPQTQDWAENRFLKFTEKEISQMPKKIRIVIRECDCTVYARKRTTGRYKCSYEIQFNRKGYRISASGRTKEEAKARFIEKAKALDVQENNGCVAVPTNFNEFAVYWFENFHKRKVSAKTFEHDIKLYYRHIQARFGKLPIRHINAVMLQSFLDGFADRPKTAKDLYSLLNQMLNMAVKHGLLRLNPISICLISNYEQVHGSLIEKDEERKLFAAYKGTEWELPFAIAIYTGLRPNEYASATIDDGFIRAINSKRHNSKGKEYKTIPITPMLRPYLKDVLALPTMPNVQTLTRRLKRVLPNHKLYDLRTTFQTRCTECGIPDAVIGVWMGNSIGKLKEAYTDFSKSFLLKEAEKFIY